MSDAQSPAPPRRLLRWLLVLAWATVIVLLSSIPDAGERLPSALRFPGSDLVAHTAVYGVLGALLAWAGGRLWPAVVAASLFGAFDEAYQATVPGRFPSVLDWAADTLGAALGAVAVAQSSRRRGRRGVA